MKICENETIDLEDVAIESNVIFHKKIINLPNALIHDNYSESCDENYKLFIATANSPRTLVQPPVKLLRFERGVRIDTAIDYLVYSNNKFISQYIAPWRLRQNNIHTAIRIEKGSIDTIKDECILGCRYGEMVWGHWFLDIFSKIIVAEQNYPNRFMYAVPSWIISMGDTHMYSKSVCEAFSAYRIPKERLIPLEQDNIYQFDNLYDVSSIRTHNCFHPEVISSIRSQLSVSKSHGGRRGYAVLRLSDEYRSINLHTEVMKFLETAKIQIVDFRKISFFEQVDMSMRGELIINSGGSGLTSLIFAPPRSKFMVLSPANWYDTYFVNMFQQLDFRYADVRGPSAATDPSHVPVAPYYITARNFYDGLRSILEM